MDKVIIVDAERCLGCRSCGMACAVAHSESKDLIKALSEDDRPTPKIIIDQVDDMVVPMQCRHCEDAPCVAICPTGAISRISQDSPVILDNDKCIGCHACIMLCPFGVIKKGRDGKSLIKCDLCAERLSEGEIPACVAACPTHALRWVSIDEVMSEKRREYVRKYRVAMSGGNSESEPGASR